MQLAALDGNISAEHIANWAGKLQTKELQRDISQEQEG
jgi:hypothetical protein